MILHTINIFMLLLTYFSLRNAFGFFFYWMSSFFFYCISIPEWLIHVFFNIFLWFWSWLIDVSLSRDILIIRSFPRSLSSVDITLDRADHSAFLAPPPTPPLPLPPSSATAARNLRCCRRRNHRRRRRFFVFVSQIMCVLHCVGGVIRGFS